MRASVLFENTLYSSEVTEKLSKQICHHYDICFILHFFLKGLERNFGAINQGEN